MIYIILLICSFVFTYLIKNYAIKKSLLAEVNERSSHSVPTPHGGGIALAITWFSGLVYLYMYDMIDKDIFYALLVGMMISIVSFFDDIFELSAKLRIFVQLFVACLGLYFLGGLEKVLVFENQIITNTFALLLIVWFINLYNFLDGIDGYAGSEAVFLGVAGFLLFGDSLFLVLIASVLGFLVWNWHRAKIFMGDVGSTLLGYNVAVFTIYYSNQDSNNLWIWIILFGLFWFDATLTLFRRYKNGEKLSQAHKKHAYQRLTQSGWSHSKVVLYSVLLNIALFCIVYFVTNLVVAFVTSLVMLYIVTRFIDMKKFLKMV
ncbi:MAG TPA: glycosyltransferase family 4 protein [Sulfurospirillum arcachonense]|nr:glycosyltransferase family 4 protein [Sulfurospirillum arcachonense]